MTIFFIKTILREFFLKFSGLNSVRITVFGKIIFPLFGMSTLFCGDAHADDRGFTPFFVGSLHAKWKFPSDHLPIGSRVHQLRIASWNVLNEKYLNFITEDGQGLHGSLITRLAHIRVYCGLSKREQVVFKQCKEMMKGKHKRSLIGLLETSDGLLQCLKQHVPRGWKCLFSPSPSHREDVFLYNKKMLRVLGSTIVQYSDTSPKIVFLLKVQDRKTGKIFAVFLTHVPGGGPEGLAQMAGIVKRLFDSSLKTILMGDMNASPNVVARALRNERLPFTVVASTYPTHINTQKEACWFDAFFAYNPSKRGFLRPDAACQIFDRMRTRVHTKKMHVFGVQNAAHLLKDRGRP